MALSGTPVTDKNDLTQGNIVKKMLLFFLPIAAGNLFQQFYNTVDALVVSKCVGTAALAAVSGTPAVVSNLIIGFCTALTAGCSVLIAQMIGARQRDAVASAVKTAYVFCALLGLAVGGAVVWLSPEILTLLNTDPEVFDGSLLYQRIYFAGAGVLLIYNIGAGILRAVGDSRFPFVALMIGCGVNIVLDLLFVAVFGWEIAGVAWATVIAQTVSAVLVTVRLLRTKDCHRLRLSSSFSLPHLKRMLSIGIPSGLQSSMYGLSNCILQAGVNSLGTVAIASWAMSGKVDGAFWSTTSAFGTALTTFIGQNFGAGNLARVKESAKKGFFTLFLLTVGVSGAILGAAIPLLHILTDDLAVVDLTWVLVLYFVPFYPIWSVIEAFSAVLRGIGDTLIPSIILAIGVCGSRILTVLTVFPVFHTIDTLCLCYPVSWSITAIGVFVYYRIRVRRLPAYALAHGVCGPEDACA